MRAKLPVEEGIVERDGVKLHYEVYGDGAAAWANEQGAAVCERHEQIGDTVFCYTRDGDRALATLDRREDVRYLHRRANLEDVFLKLTGRSLAD